MERHLHVATAVDTLSAQADRAAADLIAQVGEPESYEQLHVLVSAAYLKGSLDELQRTKNLLGGAS